MAVVLVLAGCYQYRTDSQGRVFHLHTNSYRIFNQLVTRPGAGDAAIADWHDKLASRGSVTVSKKTTWPLNPSTGDVKLYEHPIADTGGAIFVYEAYHQTGGTTVGINQNVAGGWSFDYTQTRICETIGNLLGIADTPANDISNPEDCMKPGGNKLISPEGIDAVVGFFGYGPEVDGFEGQAYERTNLLTTGVYPVSAWGSGHGLTQVSLKVDGVDPVPPVAPVPASGCATQTTTTGADNCETQLNATIGPLLTAGQHTISVTATNEFGQARTRSFTVTVRKPSVDWGFAEGWNGLQGEISRTGQHYDPATPELNGIGATSNRLFINWKSVEEQPPGSTACTGTGDDPKDYGDLTGRHCYNWDGYTGAYNKMMAAGQKPVLTLANAPVWARDPTWVNSTCASGPCMYPPDSTHYNDWRDFVRRAVEKFPDVLAIEVWNEPNHDKFWRPSADAAAYATVLGKACEGVKRFYGGTGMNCDSGVPVPVITGGLSPGPGRPTLLGANKVQQQTFLDEVYDAGAAPYFEGIGEHVYPNLQNDSTLEHWAANEEATISELRESRGNGGDSATTAPIWLTEVGVATPCTATDTNCPEDDRAVALDEQGPILAAMYDRAVLLGDIKSYLVFTYEDYDDSHQGRMGVVVDENTDKPAYSDLGCLVGERDPYC